MYLYIYIYTCITYIYIYTHIYMYNRQKHRGHRKSAVMLQHSATDNRSRREKDHDRVLNEIHDTVDGAGQQYQPNQLP